MYTASTRITTIHSSTVDKHILVTSSGPPTFDQPFFSGKLKQLFLLHFLLQLVLEQNSHHFGNESVFSYLRMLTTCHCPHSRAAAAATDPSPAHQVHSSKPAAVACGGDRQTDRQTDTRQLHRPCCEYEEGSVNKWNRFLQPK